MGFLQFTIWLKTKLNLKKHCGILLTSIQGEIDDLFALESIFILQCIARGDTVIHYDYVEVTYNEEISTYDCSAFDQDAIKVSELLDIALVNGEATVEVSVPDQLMQILQTKLGTLGTIVSLPIDFREIAISF